MREWLIANIVNLIAAVAAVIAAIASTISAWHGFSGRKRPPPVFDTSVHAFEDRPDWREVTFRVINNAEAPLTVSRLVARTLGMTMLHYKEATERDGHGGSRLRRDLPAGYPSIDVHITAEPKGSPPHLWQSGHTASDQWFRLVVHHRDASLKRISIDVAWRWRSSTSRLIWTSILIDAA